MSQDKKPKGNRYELWSGEAKKTGDLPSPPGLAPADVFSKYPREHRMPADGMSASNDMPAQENASGVGVNVHESRWEPSKGITRPVRKLESPYGQTGSGDNQS